MEPNHTSSPNAEMPIQPVPLQDYGPNPLVLNINQVAKGNPYFRTALWTGTYLQLTVMSIPPGGEIGVETHPTMDQFIHIESGLGLIQMENGEVSFQRPVQADYAFIIPAGTRHNLINTGKHPLKLFSVYSPPAHPKGTIHETKADADLAELEG